MPKCSDSYVFEVGSLVAIGYRKTSNALINAVSDACAQDRLHFVGYSLREAKEMLGDEKEVLEGVDGLTDAKVNPPNNVQARAHSIHEMDGGRELDDGDKWSLALAIELGAKLVIEREGKKADKLRNIARILSVTVITVDEFIGEETDLVNEDEV